MEISSIKQYEKYLRHPAFFTQQIHEKTLRKQISLWADIVHIYFCKNSMNESSISELNADNFELFSDKSTKIPKRLSKGFVVLIIDELCAQGKTEWKNSQSKENFFIYTTSLKEIGTSIYKWAQKNAKIGSVETLKWIIEGDDTEKSEIFYNLPVETVLKSLKILEKETGKIQVFQVDRDKYSVKFL